MYTSILLKQKMFSKKGYTSLLTGFTTADSYLKNFTVGFY